MDGTAILISYIDIGEDEIGQPEVGQVEKEIFVSKRSIGQSEYFNAARNGLRPEFCLLTSEYDYAGEGTIIYEGEQYTIYRSYHADNSDYVELYLERRAANVGKGINR